MRSGPGIALCSLVLLLALDGAVLWAAEPCPFPPQIPPPEFTGNLVANGGFEESASGAVPTGWVMPGGESPPVNATSITILRAGDPRPSSSGACSMLVEAAPAVPGQNWAVSFVQGLPHKFTPGATYYLSYWVKVIPEVAGSTMIVELWAPTDPKGTIHSKRYGNTEWAQYTLSFVAEYDTYFILFRIGAPETTAKLAMVVDDVSIVPWGFTAWWDPSSPPTTPVQPPPMNVFAHTHAFDLGGLMSPLMDGYRLVTHASVYTPAQGHGFLSTAGITLGGVQRDQFWLSPRTVTNALATDYLMALSDAPVEHTFRVDLPDGDYKVTLIIGDGERDGSKRQKTPWFNVYAQAQKVLTIAPRRDTALVADPSFWVTVNDGRLELRFSSDGQLNPRLGKQGWLVNAILVSPKADRVNDEAQLAFDLESLFLLPLPEVSHWELVPTPAPQTPVVPTAADQQRGYIPFTRCCTGLPQYHLYELSSPPQAVHYGPISPDTVPGESERSTTLALKLTPGEFEPALLGLYPVEAVDRLTWSLSALQGPDGAVPDEALPEWLKIRNIRYVPFFWSATGSPGLHRYRNEPVVLSSSVELDLTPGRTRGLWVTVHAPPGAAAGDYSAVLTLTAPDRPATAIQLLWTVLPFALQTPPDVVWGAHYDWDDQYMQDAPLVDLRDHGLNSLFLPFEYDAFAKTAQPFESWDLWNKLTRAQLHGLDRLPPWHATEPKPNYNRYLEIEKYFGPIEAGTYHEFTADERAAIASVISYVVQEIKSRNLPEVLFYMADEANCADPTPQPESYVEDCAPRHAMALQLYEIAKGVPEARTFATISDSGLQAMKAYVDFRSYVKNDAHGLVLGPELMMPEDDPAAFWSTATGTAAFWDYTPSHQATPVTSRLYSGFLMWGRGIKGHFRMSYFEGPSLGNAYNGIEKYQADLSAGNSPLIMALTYPSLSDDDPTIGWEMVREGINDYKYAYTLEQMIAQAKAGPPPKAALAQQIESDLEALRREASNSGPKPATKPATNADAPWVPWTGCDPRDVREQIITWIMQLTQSPLTVTRTGTGTGTVTSVPAGIACGATCSASFDSDVQVTLSAVADAGSMFGGWRGACTGSGPCRLTMDGSKSVTATFDLRPDLVVASVTPAMASVAPGGRLGVTVTVQNQGPGPASASTTRLYLSRDTARGAGDWRLGPGLRFPALTAGSVDSRTASVVVPRTLPPGDYFVLACADDLRRVAESEETNNCQASSAGVAVMGPDLVVESVSPRVPSVQAGGQLVVETTLRNAGSLRARTSVMRFYLAVESRRTADSRLQGGGRTFAALAPGVSATGAAVVSVAPATPAGTYFVLACADDLGRVTERDETNNCRASQAPIEVTPP